MRSAALSASREIADKRLIRSFSYIGGKWTGAQSGAVITVTNPASGEVLGEVAALSGAQAAQAIGVAQAAFGPWAARLPQERAALLRRWHGEIMAHREDLARIMVLEQGKPLSEARGEIEYAASFVAFYAEEATRLNIESITSHLPGAALSLSREPLGVAALITPWNFPSAMLTRKAAAALAAGCTTLCHPSAETPFSALALAELAERAGLPAGVLNVITGAAPEIVGPWMADARVRAVSFTGSTGVGRLLCRQAADTMKRVVMELGGHAPVLVFADADIERAVAETIKAKFATSGQDCLAANRIMVERPLYPAFCAAFTRATRALSVGPGLADCDIGPLMNAAAIEKQKAHVADALARGARLACGGTVLPAGPLFYAPTVLTDVPPDAAIWHEETFGPVAAIAPFETEDEALERANASDYGLVAYLHTQSAPRISRLTRGLQYGMVAVNRTKITGAPIPFGGVKQSGLGREGARLGIEAFCDVKYVCQDME